MTLLWLLIAGSGTAGDEARVTEVTPAQADSLLVAHLRTDGLPGEKLLQSMLSGLTSALELELTLLDERRQILGGSRMSLQLGFDLWEEVFSVRGPGADLRFRTLVELQRYLGDLGPIEVADLGRLQPEVRYRLRVGLQLHAIAPAQKEQVEDVIVGDHRARREGQDRQEASVSLGRLIRLFYKSGDRRDGVQQALSGWFTREELRDAPH